MTVCASKLHRLHCCFPWSTGSMSVCCAVRQRFLSFSGHSKLLYKLSPMPVQWFPQISLLLEASKWLAFLPRTAILSSCWFIFSSQAKPKAKTKSRHSELFVVQPINLTGHIWATRKTCQSHVPIILLP